ncbi:MAG: D-alanyl-D-alanine carboxypeptidase [Clostridia bacterium]|nr:D-alanyl-D-alanine carboxypeptidase [Clostridia bacterium]
MKRERGAKQTVLIKRISKGICGVCLILALALALTSLPVGAMPTENGAESDLGLDCKSAILIEASTGKVLYEQNTDEALPPASVTKVMTLLLVMEAIEAGKIKYSDTVRASANACSMGGSQIFLEENEEMSVEDLIKSVVIASANDAAVALAEYVAGTEEAFVKQMNEKARALGMKNTNFENTNGLDDTAKNHFTSARDIAIMSRELIKYPKITEYSSIWMDSIRNGEFGLTNTNRLVRFYKGATGLKTGSTSKAGFCISATAERDGMSLICVIMGAPSRDVRNAAATSLLDYGFANYCIYKTEKKDFADIPVSKGCAPTVDAECSEFSAVMKKSDSGEVKMTVDLPERLTAPIEKGEVVGEVMFSTGETELGRVEIVANESVDGMSFGNMILAILGKCALIM